jgi:hypothetical protein
MNWDGYLEGFHAERPGITESVLRRARAGGTDPYDWLAEVVPRRGRVLDLGCGSAPLFRALEGLSSLPWPRAARTLRCHATRPAQPGQVRCPAGPHGQLRCSSPASLVRDRRPATVP